MIYTVEMELVSGERVKLSLLAASPEHAEELALAEALRLSQRPVPTKENERCKTDTRDQPTKVA